MSYSSDSMSEIMGEGDIAFPHLGIYLKNVIKSFNIGGLTIAMYGVIIAVGVLLAFSLISAIAKKDGQNSDDFYEAGFVALLMGIIGARVYYVIFAWEYYKNDLAGIFNIRRGGLAIYGGVIFGFLAFIIYTKIKKWNTFGMLDTAVCGVLTGQIVGRWGNFTNREVFGRYTDSLFAMRLPVKAVRERDITMDLRSHIPAGANYIQVHPTFLYEGFCNLILLLVIIFMRKKKAFDGECALWYLGGYGIIRYFMEGIRTDRLLIPGTGIAVSQLLGILMFAASLAADIIIRIKLNRQSPDIVEE